MVFTTETEKYIDLLKNLQRNVKEKEYGCITEDTNLKLEEEALENWFNILKRNTIRETEITKEYLQLLRYKMNEEYNLYGSAITMKKEYPCISYRLKTNSFNYKKLRLFVEYFIKFIYAKYNVDFEVRYIDFDDLKEIEEDGDGILNIDVLFKPLKK